MHKTLNYNIIHSSKKHRQSNKVNNTATKHSLCPENVVYKWSISNSNKATSHTKQFVQCPQQQQQQKHDIKKHKNIFKIKKKHLKTSFKNLYKEH